MTAVTVILLSLACVGFLAAALCVTAACMLSSEITQHEEDMYGR